MSFILKHSNETRIVEEVRQDALDGDQAVGSIHALLSSDEDLCHASLGNSPEQGVVAKGDTDFTPHFPYRISEPLGKSSEPINNSV